MSLNAPSAKGRGKKGSQNIEPSRSITVKEQFCADVNQGNTVLHKGLRALESIVLDREVLHMRESLSLKFAQLIYNGYWFSPEFKLLEHSMNHIAEKLTGTVKLKLYKGQCSVLGRKSPNSLYSEQLATFEEDDVYDQSDAEGFIKINALRLTL